MSPQAGAWGPWAGKPVAQKPLHPGLWSEKAPFSSLSKDKNKKEINTEAGEGEGTGRGTDRLLLVLGRAGGF